MKTINFFEEAEDEQTSQNRIFLRLIKAMQDQNEKLIALTAFIEIEENYLNNNPGNAQRALLLEEALSEYMQIKGWGHQANFDR